MKNDILASWREIKKEDEILIKSLTNKDEVLLKKFTKKLSFGTAGIRGIMGAGTNQINEFTIALAAQSYAQYLLNKNKKNTIIIGHDNRNNSILYSKITAKVLMNNGIKAILFKENKLQPTPLVSFAIRKLKLDGGVMITASHNPKEYNGFKVYNNFGGQLMPEETEKIQKYMALINPLTIKKYSGEIFELDQTIINDYIANIIKKIIIDKNAFSTNLKVAFSPLQGTAGLIMPTIMDQLHIDYKIVTKQNNADGNFPHTKSSNPEEAKAYKKVVRLAKKIKADIALVTDPDADRIGIVVKYKKRYKFLNGNQVASLYLNYKLDLLSKTTGIPKDAYIIKSNVSSNLPSKIAKKYNVKIIETNVGFKNMAQIMESTKGTLMMAFEESYGMLTEASISRDKDSFQAAVAIFETLSYIKKIGSNGYEYFKNIEKEFGIHRTIQKSFKVNKKQTNKLMDELIKINELDEKKISTKIKEKNNFVKVVFDDESWVAIRPSGTEEKLKVYIENIGKKNQTSMDIVAFEKSVENFVQDNIEVFEEKKWSWKAGIKYSIFMILIIGIMAIVFTKIYPQGIGNKNGDIWGDMKTVLNTLPRVFWMTMLLFVALDTFISAWMRKRLIEFQGQKVKVRHLIISSLMGVIISYITPFGIGGDAIGYWYLRKKGIKRGVLLSSFITSTIIYQVGFIAQSIILVSLGIPIYKSILFAGTIESKSTFILYIIGFGWDIFSTIMILLLALGKRFQEFIVRNSVKFLEWMPFVTIFDAGGKSSSYQYEFREMRLGLKKIWTKKLLIFEIIIYELIPKFINGMALWLTLAGVIDPGVLPNRYMAQIIGSDMVGTANSMSLTPGGSGTGEWLSLQVSSQLYVKDFHGIKSSTSLAGATDLLGKVVYTWPHLLVSTLMILTIIIGEKRKKLYRKNKVDSLTKTKTTFYKFAFVFWAFLLIGYILFIQFI